ncbi:MAG: hypothetical protein GXD23_12835 [Comamonadaceae bacterium]|jgi:hypothetical protein|uniref:Uncharacterized protein n=1 Tax=Hydrogenophaga borbori TaxID=2294117 RepID=A0A372EJ81_9BURK|nr:MULTISPECIES: hypothetical protein [Hydrogenophaga]NCT98249.1 hypothetical protein [Comamonadaceae bacterium]RFP78714.1 hypothetical protein DY262_11530 [Hydrogenophaga borbori]WQB83861.1 hypothetical protein SOM08_00685 [Hydrogenophaga sp. SNF1]
MNRPRKTQALSQRFEARSVQLLAAWTLVIAGAAATGPFLQKPRQGATPSGLSLPSAQGALPGPMARGARR